MTQNPLHCSKPGIHGKLTDQLRWGKAESHSSKRTTSLDKVYSDLEIQEKIDLPGRSRERVQGLQLDHTSLKQKCEETSIGFIQEKK